MSLQALKNINRTAAAKNEQPQGFPAMLEQFKGCLLYTSPSPRDRTRSRMPSSA
mgnify:CR=1 FL=1